MVRFLTIVLLLWLAPQQEIAAQKCQKVAVDYRKAIVHLKAEKVHKNGAIDDVEGTGFILSNDGYLLTNYHVISRDPDVDRVQITGAIGSRNEFRYPVLLITADEQHDLALLQLENSSQVYQAVLIGEPWNVNPGAGLCSLGFPLQQEFHYSSGALGGKAAKNGWWTTEIPSNPGESGAPVFSDSTGKVVALKVAGYDDAQNINLVIPINLAGALIAQVPGSALPSATKPSNAAAVMLPSGSVTLYNGFRNYAQSVFNFSTQSVKAWGSQDADLGVANPSGDKALALFFANNDAPPYTDPANPNHPIENAGLREMPTSNLDEVTSCPVSDYKIHYVEAQINHVYCVRTRDGHHWAKIKVNVIAPDRIEFDYVYQPSGSPSF